jgi:hypothetical protein
MKRTVSAILLLGMLFGLCGIATGTEAEESLPPYLTLASGYESRGISEIHIPEGYLAEMIVLKMKDGNGTPPHKSALHQIDGLAEEYSFSLTLHPDKVPLTLPTFAGPLDIRLWANTSSESKAFTVLKITEISQSEVIPKNTVVIPADASGPVEIILESSEDLITWTPADASAYGRGRAKRFFSVRSLVQESK